MGVCPEFYRTKIAANIVGVCSVWCVRIGVSSLSLTVTCTFQSILSNCRVLYFDGPTYWQLTVIAITLSGKWLNCSFGRLELIIVNPIIMICFFVNFLNTTSTVLKMIRDEGLYRSWGLDKGLYCYIVPDWGFRAISVYLFHIFLFMLLSSELIFQLITSDIV